MLADPKVPARVLSPADVDTLLARLRDLVCHPGVIPNCATWREAARMGFATGGTYCG
jgi:hypothetical protein